MAPHTYRLPGITALALFFVASAAHAATIRVSTTADDTANNGNCTLREAVIAANTDTAVDACAGGTGADIIVLPAGTCALSLLGSNEDVSRTGDLDVLDDLTIRGRGVGVSVIDGGMFEYRWESAPFADRVIHVLTGATLALSGVTIRGGVCVSGAGILNAGTLAVLDSGIEHNHLTGNTECHDASAAEAGDEGGGGIYNKGALTVSRSIISDNDEMNPGAQEAGGGLLNLGRAKITSSVVSGNYAGAAGGIENHGTLEVADTEISHNGVRFFGSGLRNRSGGTAHLERTTIKGNAGGGGIFNGGQAEGSPGGAIVLRNSTVSSNESIRVPGSVINWGGSVEIVNSTIADNAGEGIGGPAPVRLQNTIVANPGYSDCADLGVISLGNNLDRDGTCGLGAPGDLSNTDPVLGPLADNGGPTLTHALLAGSPAIDRVPTSQCPVATDQRGVARPQPPKRGACDIGAYEFSPSGDIELITEDVLVLGAVKLLAQSQVDVLVGSLKGALIDAEAGHASSACARLDEFIQAVSGYVSHASLSPEAADPLLAAARGAQGMLCP